MYGLFGVNLTGNAQPVLLKNSTRSRPQGRNADFSLVWIGAETADDTRGTFRLRSYGL